MMKYLSLVLVLLTLPILVRAQVSDFVFISDTSIPSGELTQVTVEARNGAGDAEAVGDTTCLLVESDSSSGEFAANESSDLFSSLVLTMNSNWTKRNFYYQDNSSGSHILSVSVAVQPEEVTCSSWPTDGWNISWTAQQTVSIGGGEQEEEEEESEEEESSSSNASSASSGGDPAPSREPGLRAVAGPDRRVFVGTKVVFEGDAVDAYGDTEDGVVYLWNFGDGLTARGSSVSHTYTNVGTYVATLFVDELHMNMDDTDQAVIEVIEADIEITDVDFAQGSVDITNTSSKDADLSGWQVSVAGSRYRLPDFTHILAGASVTLKLSETPLSRGNVALVLPSGQYASVQNSKSVTTVPVYRTPVAVVAPAPVARAATSEDESMATVTTAAATYAATEALGEGEKEEKSGTIISWLLAVAALGLICGVVIIAVRRESNIV